MHMCRLRRDQDHICTTMINRLLYKADSNINLSSMVTQQDFLNTLQQRLMNEATAGDVLAAMATIRERLSAASNLRVVMATDVHSLPHPSPIQPWDKFLPPQSDMERYNHCVIYVKDGCHYFDGLISPSILYDQLSVYMEKVLSVVSYT